MRKNTLMISTLVVSLMLVNLPAETSDIDSVEAVEPVINIDIDNNIAVLEGKVASARQSIEAEQLIFAMTGIDWVENKLKVDPAIKDSDLSGLILPKRAI